MHMFNVNLNLKRKNSIWIWWLCLLQLMLYSPFADMKKESSHAQMNDSPHATCSLRCRLQHIQKWGQLDKYSIHRRSHTKTSSWEDRLHMQLEWKGLHTSINRQQLNEKLTYVFIHPKKSKIWRTPSSIYFTHSHYT